MGSTGVKVRAIAWTAFQETLRRKVFYLVGFLALLAIAIIASSAVTTHMATEAGETAVVTRVQTGTVVQILDVWEFAVGVLSLYLGAIALSSEVAGRTLVNVLSRPVEYATYLSGRWIGTLGFLWGFQATGVLLAVGTAIVFKTPHSPVLWLACASMFVSAFFFSGVSLGLSVMMPPPVAGAIAFFLTILPSIVDDTLHHPRWIGRALSNVAYYASPAKMPVSLLGESFNKELLHPAYGLYERILGENLLYAIVVFAIGCAVFSRRETRLR